MNEIIEGLLSPAEKLGIKPGTCITVVDAPPDYHMIVGKLPRKCVVLEKLEYNADFIHFFSRDKKTLAKRFPDLKKHLYDQGVLWVSFPAAPDGGVPELDENTVRDIGLASGLVDIRTLSLGDTWQAMKFIYRIKDIPAWDKKIEVRQNESSRV
jgi:hypothetical protein